MKKIIEMTNASKAQIIVVINAIFALLQAFGVDMSDEQQGTILVLVNALFALWVAGTYNYSRKRKNGEV